MTLCFFASRLSGLFDFADYLKVNNHHLIFFVENSSCTWFLCVWTLHQLTPPKLPQTLGCNLVVNHVHYFFASQGTYHLIALHLREC